MRFRAQVTAAVWLKLAVVNLFNNDKSLGSTRRLLHIHRARGDSLGLRRVFVRGSNLGEARGTGDYPM